MSQGVSSRRWGFVGIVCVLLFGVAAALYWPACDNGFVRWDDHAYVFEEPQILRGICFDGICWALTANVEGNWHPLTLISLQTDAQLFGTGPSGFHRTSVILHALNSVLAFVTIWMLTGGAWRSLICGFLFAVHPMRVESVAWIAERKDVLSGTFFFLTVLAYIHYVRAPNSFRYLQIVFCLMLGLTAKSMLVTTPCVLLLLDYWPLGRCHELGFANWRQWLRLIWEKLPLFGLSLVAAFLNLIYQNRVGAIKSLNEVPFPSRFSNAVTSYVAYLSQTFWPVGLSPYYLQHQIAWPSVCWAIIVLCLLTGIALWQQKRRPYLLVGWLWFVLMLVPVIGLLQAGGQARADRYMYLSQLGIYLAVVWWLASLFDRTRLGKMIGTAVAVTFIAGCSYVTAQQITVWKDTRSMWLQVYRLDKTNFMALSNLTRACFVEGSRDEAIEIMTDAIRTCVRSNPAMLEQCAILLADFGEQEAAISTLSEALTHYPDRADLYSSRGKAFAALGKWREAADDYQQASALSPKSASYRFYLAHAFGKLGDHEAANENYRAALKQSPDWPQKSAALAWRMTTNPDPYERVASWPAQLAEQANEATGSTDPVLLDVLAVTYADAGRFDEAVTTAKLAIQKADQAKKTSLSAAIRKRLALYAAGKPFREAPMTK